MPGTVRLTCKECGHEYTRHPCEAVGSKYCCTLCGNRAKNRLAIISKRKNARLRRPQVQSQPKTYKFIPLSATDFAKVDNQDYEWVNEEVWRKNDKGYATNDSRPRRMHVRIMERKLGRKLLLGEQVDHKNRDRLDNRRRNLRLANTKLNSYNMLRTNGRSRYKGVYWNSRVNSWQSCIDVDGVRVHIGTFDNELDAAYRYDQFAMQLFGDFAYLNVLTR